MFPAHPNVVRIGFVVTSSESVHWLIVPSQILLNSSAVRLIPVGATVNVVPDG